MIDREKKKSVPADGYENNFHASGWQKTYIYFILLHAILLVRGVYKSRQSLALLRIKKKREKNAHVYCIHAVPLGTLNVEKKKKTIGIDLARCCYIHCSGTHAFRSRNSVNVCEIGLSSQWTDIVAEYAHTHTHKCVHIYGRSSTYAQCALNVSVKIKAPNESSTEFWKAYYTYLHTLKTKSVLRLVDACAHECKCAIWLRLLFLSYTS